MASEGSVYQRKDGRWVAQYTDARGKTRYPYRKSKGEAKDALWEALRDRDDGIVPPSKITFGMYGISVLNLLIAVRIGCTISYISLLLASIYDASTVASDVLNLVSRSR
jgi:hypothetical protein